jgi:hypothetical protein
MLEVVPIIVGPAPPPWPSVDRCAPQQHQRGCCITAVSQYGVAGPGGVTVATAPTAGHNSGRIVARVAASASADYLASMNDLSCDAVWILGQVLFEVVESWLVSGTLGGEVGGSPDVGIGAY